jgi:hypothetical protein
MVCVHNSIVLSTTEGPYTYKWTQDTTTLGTESSVTVTPLVATSYVITSKVISAAGCTSRDTVTVSLYPAPNVPVITQHHDTLFCHADPSYVSYQWYDDTTKISSLGDTMIILNHQGYYSLQVTDQNGCSIVVGVNVIGIREFEYKGSDFTLMPNPADNMLTIRGNTALTEKDLVARIYNIIGKNIYEQPVKFNGKKQTIDVSALSPGIYYLQLVGNKGQWVGRFIKL